MLKKTLATGALVIATGTGALVMSPIASAATPSWGGGWGGWGYHSTRLFSLNRNFNANRNVLFNRIRLRIHNRNNNVAVNNQAQRENQRQFQFETP